MTTLDSLLVRIDASTELLRRELQKGGVAVDSFARSTDKRLGGFEQRFSKIGASLRTALGVFGIGFGVTAVANFTRGAIQAADAIGETAKQAGFGAERFQRLGFVFRQSGVSAMEFDNAMRTANTRLGQFIQTGAGPAAKAIEQLGLKQRILNGEIRTNEQFFDAVVKALEGVDNAAQHAALSAAFFGREIGAKMAPAMKQGVDAMNQAADSATGIFTDETVRKADALGDSMERLGAATWNWAKGLAIAASYELGKTFGADEIVALEATAERRLATLRERQRTLRTFGNKPLSPSEQTELDDLEAQIANRTRYRTGGTMDDVNRSPAGPDDGLDFISGQIPSMPSGLRRFDFAGAANAVLNTELKEISVVIAKMPDDLKKLSPEFNAAVASLQKYNDGLTEAAKRQQELWQTLGHGLHSALASAFRSSRMKFSDFLKDMAADLAASGLMKGLFTILGGPAAVAAGGFKGFLAGVFGGSRAKGGPVERGKGYLVNDGDPELFWPGMSGSMVPVAAGGGQSFHIETHIDARGADPSLAQRLPSILADNNQRVKAEIKHELGRRR